MKIRSKKTLLAAYRINLLLKKYRWRINVLAKNQNNDKKKKKVIKAKILKILGKKATKTRLTTVKRISTMIMHSHREHKYPTSNLQ